MNECSFIAANLSSGTFYGVIPQRIASAGLRRPSSPAIVGRLHRLAGQIRGMRVMAQERRLCVDILQHLAAAEAALNRISLAV
jgi:hypothetical protein